MHREHRPHPWKLPCVSVLRSKSACGAATAWSGGQFFSFLSVSRLPLFLIRSSCCWQNKSELSKEMYVCRGRTWHLSPSPHMHKRTSPMRNVSLLCLELSRLLFRFLLSPLQTFLSFLLFFFPLFKSLFYYWAQSCNSLSWRHLRLTDGTMLKWQFCHPSNYLMLRICFKILCNRTSVLEICYDFRRETLNSLSSFCVIEDQNGVE